MKTIELKKFNLIELNEIELRKIEGGNPFWIGIGIGIGVMAAYDFINGVYTGIKEELAKEE